VPLWLRLEWNCVDFELAVKHLDDRQGHHCNAEGQHRNEEDFRKKQCAPWLECRRGKDIKIHLFCLDLQNQIEEEAPELAPIPAGLSNVNVSLTGPVILLLDTNAILAMLNCKDCKDCGKDPNRIASLFSVDTFNFQNILSRHRKSQKQGKSERDFILCICTTIRNELDYRKKVMPHIRHCLRRIVSDDSSGEDSYLSDMVRSGIAVLPKSLQAEMALGQSHSRQVVEFSAAQDTNTQNDLKLINIAAYYRSRSKNAIIISNDNGVISMARSHGVPVESLKELDKNLKRIGNKKEWDTETMTKCLRNAKKDLSGQQMSDDVEENRSVFDHLEEGSRVVDKLTSSYVTAMAALASIQSVLDAADEEAKIEKIREVMASITTLPSGEQSNMERKKLMEQWSKLIKSSDPFQNKE